MILAPASSQDNLNNLIKKFKATEIVCIGDERLYNKLELLCDKIFIENTGYVKEHTLALSINRYFNGVENEYTPCSFIVRPGTPVKPD